MTVKDEVINIVNTKLTGTDAAAFDVVMSVDEVEAVILNYCNISVVPKELKFTWANMVVDLIRYQYEANRTEELEDTFDARDVSILSVGDTEIDFRGLGNTVKNRTLKSHQADLDNLVMNYKTQLVRFRRMVW